MDGTDAAQPTSPAAGVPFMVTNAMRQQMRARGYTVEQIRNMRPEQIHAILNEPGDPSEGPETEVLPDGAPAGTRLADRAEIASFVDALFRHADADTYANLRGFQRQENGEDKLWAEKAVRLTDGGREPLVDAATLIATSCANSVLPVVFAPPVAAFANDNSAKADNLANGLALSVECDAYPVAARERLEGLLGPATVVVESGGEWVEPETGEVQPKMHLHWRLTEPTRSTADHKRLRHARAVATELVGADATNIAIVHPIRWPGSWHRKAAPRLARIVALNEGAEIELGDAIERLNEARGAGGRDDVTSSARPHPAPNGSGGGVDLTAIFGPDGFIAQRSGEPAADPLDVAAALAVIGNPDLHWDEWNRVGMATWRATEGAGFAIFDAWSHKSSKYDLAATRARWEHYFSSPPTEIGAGTLFRLAKEACPGWRKPSAHAAEAAKGAQAQSVVGAGDNSTTAPLRIIDPRTLYGLPIPQRRWVVDQWMPWGQTTSLYGDGGLGKSLLAQQLMTSVSLGLPWLGLDTTACRVLGVFCEDDEDELHRRQADINASLGIGFDAAANFRWISRVGFDNLLMTFDGKRGEGVGQLTEFWRQIVRAAGGFGAQLVIIDTAADTFGGNENIRPQVRQFIQMACTKLARELDGAVLLCAHPSLSGLKSGEGSGGSTAWNNSVRSRWYLCRPSQDEDGRPDDGARILSKKKANYAARGDDLAIQWHAGVFRPAIAPANYFVAHLEQARRMDEAEAAFLACLRARNEQGRPVSDSPNAPKNYAPKVFAERPEAAGFSERELKDAMERLFDKKCIRGKAKMGRNAWRNSMTGIAECDPNEPAEDDLPADDMDDADDAADELPGDDPIAASDEQPSGDIDEGEPAAPAAGVPFTGHPLEEHETDANAIF
jgi:RecA-family ATPase